ncbi:MAG TPA: LCP family protein [Candidatus Saccharimonadales bacterium]
MHGAASSPKPHLRETLRRAPAAPARPATPTIKSIIGEPPKHAATPSAANFSYSPRFTGTDGKGGDKPPKKPRRFSWRWFKGLSWKKKVLTILTLLIIIGGVIGGWLGWRIYRDVAKLTHDANPFSLLQVFHPVALKNQDGRVNILIGGDSVDRTDEQANGGDLTDSIMVLSIDTHTDTAFMLSIPRDTWVQLPDNGGSLAGTHQKINAANTLTKFSAPGYPSGGMGALEYVINQNFGIPIDYYSLVNYTAFEDLVDALGGITVNIQSSDPRGLYDPQPFPGSKAFKLANGVQTLNGIEALDLARARGDAYGSYGFPQSDFDRTEHQRWMVMAIKDKASSASVIANPFKVADLIDAVGSNVTTDLKLNEVETLYTLTKKLNDNNITSVNINTLNGANTTLLANYRSPTGQDALIPAAGLDDFSDIQHAIQKLLSSNPLVKESANVVVVNAGNLVGLARAEATALTAKGMVTTASYYSPPTQTANTLIDNSSNADPNTKSYLQSQFKTIATTNATLTKEYPNADFILVLGTSQAMPAASTSSTSSSSTGD